MYNVMPVILLAAQYDGSVWNELWLPFAVSAFFSGGVGLTIFIFFLILSMFKIVIRFFF